MTRPIVSTQRTRRINRTFKVSKGLQGSLVGGEIILQNNGRATWIVVRDGDLRLIGTIDSQHTLRKLAEGILEALPPKRGAK